MLAILVVNLKTVPFKYRLLSLFAASLILVASFGVFVESHYCKGELQDVGFFQLAETCTDMDVLFYGDVNGMSIQAKPCCENHTLFEVLDEDAQVVEHWVKVPDLDIVSPIQFESFSVAEQPFIGQKYVEPPSGPDDIQLEFQQFLI